MNNENGEIDEMVFDEPLEDEDENVDIEPGQRMIYTDQGDPEIDSLYKKYKKGTLIIQPDFQRHFVWDANKSSKLIESALLEIPLPMFYLSEETDGKIQVIDGQQRLSSFFSYIDGKLPDSDKEFKLSGLKVLTYLNRKAYKDIDQTLQDKISDFKIRTITFRKESDSDLKFEIFERLNTGSVALNDQELRNCIYRGPYNKLLKELSQDYEFMKAIGITKPAKRMQDIELVLRFSAFYHNSYLNYKPPMRRFLNDEMERYKNISEKDADELRKAFKNAIQINLSLFGNHAFKRYYKGVEGNPDGHWEPKKFNFSLYDILMWAFAREDKNKVYQNLDSIYEAVIYLMTEDVEFIEAIEKSTSSIQAVTKRFDKIRKTLQDILGVAQKEPRCFSRQLKEEMYRKDDKCSICGQKISSVDDAALDHIKQYWTGGKTVPDNARLTHRFCNWSRPRNDHKEGS